MAKYCDHKKKYSRLSADWPPLTLGLKHYLLGTCFPHSKSFLYDSQIEKEVMGCLQGSTNERSIILVGSKLY